MATLPSLQDVRGDLILRDWLARNVSLIQDGKNPDKYFVNSAYPESLLDRCRCTDGEMESLVPLVQFILRLHETIRRKGLRGITEDYDPDDIPDPFLKSTLNLVLDGYRAEKLAHILNLQIGKSRDSGRTLMKKILVADGCLSLVKGNTLLHARQHYETFFFRFKFQVNWNTDAG